MNPQNIEVIHIIGIGGIGASALARHLLAQGKKVSGSDANSSSQTEALKKEGVTIHIGHQAKNIPENCDLVIFSLAIPEQNPEFQEVAARGIQKMSYPQALGFFMQNKKSICVIGTHGKTTVTGMIGKIMKDAGLDPVVVIGTNVAEWGNKNYQNGKGEYAVLESCEYKKAFLGLNPHIAVITNIDLDHLDYYQDKKDYDNAFAEFLKKVPHDGQVIYHAEDPSSRAIAEALKCRKEDTEAAQKNLEGSEIGVPGSHNRKNAALAYATGRALGINEESIKKSLAAFQGTKRRFEYKGTMTHEANIDGKKETKVYDDYGHHPIEIQATLQGAREKFPHEKILAIFQPHQYSRTRLFLNEFATSFKNANAVIIPNIYEARDTEEDKKSISKEILAAAIEKNGTKAFTTNSTEDIRKIGADYDIVITIGAGDIWKIGEQFMQ